MGSGVEILDSGGEHRSATPTTHNPQELIRMLSISITMLQVHSCETSLTNRVMHHERVTGMLANCATWVGSYFLFSLSGYKSAMQSGPSRISM